MENRLAELRRLMRLYSTWLTVKLLGKDLVSKEDLAELKKYGKLPQGDEVDLIGNAFSLGRASAFEKKGKYSKITLDKLSMVEKYRHRTADKLAVREAKLHAAASIQKAVDRALAKATDQVSEANSKLVSSAISSGIIADEVALAVKEKKTREQLASSISNKIKADITADIKKIAVTELHRTKQIGVATAIANKVDIYKKSEGLDSQVSVVPNKNACKDCKDLYLDDERNPKVLSLKELLSNGSNADPGVTHTRTDDGKRSGWKVVLPPAHPNCYCELTYVPQGMAWMNGKMTRVEPIKKAVDQGSMAATVKPPGPPQPGPKMPPQAGNTAGLPKVGGEAATEPLGGGGDSPNPGHESADLEYWGNRTGTPDPQKGWYQNENGTWVKEHGAAGPITQNPGDGEGQGAPKSPEERAAAVQRSTNYMKQPHTDDETLGHLKTSDITVVEPLGSKSAPGINDAKKAHTADNGPGILKSSWDGTGMDCNNEKDTYSMFRLAGSSRCAPTTTRMVEGKHHSFQGWLDNAQSACHMYKDLVDPEGARDQSVTEAELVQHMVHTSGNQTQMLEQLSDIAIMDLVVCNTDRHMNNIMTNEDFSEVWAIDHGFCFGTGIQNTKNVFAEGLRSNNRKIKCSEERANWLSNISYSDIQRTASSTAEWRQAQTYLRAKFVSQVVQQYGPDLKWDYMTLDNNFNRFVFDYIDTHASNPNSPEHSNAKHFQDMGVVMDPIAGRRGRQGLLQERARGEQYEYEKKARADLWYEDNKGNVSVKTAYGSKLREVRGEIDNKYDEELKKRDSQIYEKDLELRNVTVDHTVLSNELKDMQDRGMKGENISHTEFRQKLDQLKALEVKKKELKTFVDQETRIHKDLTSKKYKEYENASYVAKMAIASPELKIKLTELDQRIAKAKSNYVPKKKAKLDYSKLRPKKKTNKAAEIQQAKVQRGN